MSWVLLSLGVYTFVYCMVLLFLENFSGGTLFGMDKQVIAALIGASVSVAAILGSIIKDRISEKGEHEGLSKEHVALKEQINNEHNALEKQLSAEQTRLDHLHDESIRMESFRKDIEKQGIDATSLKASIDALIQNNGENLNHVRDLTRALEKTEQILADTKKKLRDREWEQLKQQIYNLQHPQQSWDEPER